MINDSTRIRVIPAVWLVLFHSDFQWFSSLSNVGNVLYEKFITINKCLTCAYWKGTMSAIAENKTEWAKWAKCDKRIFAPFQFRTRVCPLRVRRCVHWATAGQHIDFMFCSVFISSIIVHIALTTKVILNEQNELSIGIVIWVALWDHYLNHCI